MEPIYLHNWSNKDDMIADFNPSWYYEKNRNDDFDHVEVILASYGTDNYSGDAFVLFRDTRDGELYEVNGNHCSCYGLEGQWEPEITSVAALKHRLNQGYLGTDNYSDNWFKEEITEVLKQLES